MLLISLFCQIKKKYNKNNNNRLMTATTTPNQHATCNFKNVTHPHTNTRKPLVYFIMVSETERLLGFLADAYSIFKKSLSD
jgi:hypothetical protein